jgi:predicted RNA-binding Zn-ribbon protein involved in translation (DUF1610 family)
LRHKQIIDKYLTHIQTTSTNEEVYRCPVCGDSKNKYKGHLYISQDYKYICFKCGIKGNDIRKMIMYYLNVS